MTVLSEYQELHIVIRSRTWWTQSCLLHKHCLTIAPVSSRTPMVYLAFTFSDGPIPRYLFLELQHQAEELFFLSTPPRGVLIPDIWQWCESRACPAAWPLDVSMFTPELHLGSCGSQMDVGLGVSMACYCQSGWGPVPFPQALPVPTAMQTATLHPFCCTTACPPALFPSAPPIMDTVRRIF